jgi:hypothetical protein
MTSFGGEVKPLVPCCEILQNVKEPCQVWKRYFVGRICGHFSPSFSCFATRCLLITTRKLWWMNQEWLVLRWGTRNISVIVTVHGMPCVIQPYNSNSITKICIKNVLYIHIIKATFIKSWARIITLSAENFLMSCHQKLDPTPSLVLLYLTTSCIVISTVTITNCM